MADALAITIQSITLNSAPLIIDGQTQSGPVTIYPVGDTPPPPVLLTWDLAQSGFGTITVQITGTATASYVLRLGATTQLIASSATSQPAVFPAGLFLTPDGQGLGPSYPPYTTPPFTLKIDLTLWPPTTYYGAYKAMGIFAPNTYASNTWSNAYFLCQPLQWFWQFYSNGLPVFFGAPVQNPPQYFQPPLPASEIYCGLVTQTDPISIEDLRLLVAQDMAQPFLQSIGTFPTGPQVAAACTNAAWQTPPVYDWPDGRASYGGGDNFKLQDWLCALQGINAAPATCNCEDTAAMCCLVLEQQASPEVASVWAAMCGRCKTGPTVVRGLPGTGPVTFNYHWASLAECPLAGGPFVCDATVGPHLATETPSQYFADVGTTPPEFGSWDQPPTPDVFSPYVVWMPTSVDGQNYTAPSIARNPAASSQETERIAAFAGVVGIGDTSPPDAALIACRWPDPRACPAVPSTYKCAHYRTTYGYPMSERYWVLADGANALHLRIWVASDTTQSAWGCFLREGAAHDAPPPIFKKGIDVGHASAMRTWDRGTEHLWVRANVVFGVTTIGTGIDIEKLVTWLDAIAAAAKPEDFKRPVISSLAVSNPRPAVGTRTTIDVTTDRSYPLKLNGLRPLLQLVDGDGKQLTLAALQPGDTTVGVIAGDPDTLLSAQQTTAISVDSLSRGWIRFLGKLFLMKFPGKRG